MKRANPDSSEEIGPAHKKLKLDEYSSFITEEEQPLNVLKEKNRNYFSRMKKMNNDLEKLRNELNSIQTKFKVLSNTKWRVYQVWKLFKFDLHLLSVRVPHVEVDLIMNVDKKLNLGDSWLDDKSVDSLIEDFNNAKIQFSRLCKCLGDESLFWQTVQSQKFSPDFVPLDNQKLEKQIKIIEEQERDRILHLQNYEEELEQLNKNLSRANKENPDDKSLNDQLQIISDQIERERRSYHRMKLQLERQSRENPKIETNGSHSKEVESINKKEIKESDYSNGSLSHKELSDIKSNLEKKQKILDDTWSEKIIVLNKIYQHDMNEALTLLQKEKISEHPLYKQCEAVLHKISEELDLYTKHFNEVLNEIQMLQNEKLSPKKFEAYENTKKLEDDKILQAEKDLKKLQCEELIMSYDLEKQRGEMVKSEVMEQLSSAVTQLQEQAEKEESVNARLESQLILLKEQISNLENLQNATEEDPDSNKAYTKAVQEYLNLQQQLQEYQLKEIKWRCVEKELKFLVEFHMKKTPESKNVEELNNEESQARQQLEKLWEQYFQFKSKVIEDELKSERRNQLIIDAAKNHSQSRKNSLYKNELDALKKQLEDEKRENERLVKEIGNAENLYKKITEESNKVTKRMTESEDANTNLVAERIKLAQLQAQIQKKIDATMEKLSKIDLQCDTHQEQINMEVHRIESLEEELRRINLDIIQKQKENEELHQNSRNRSFQAVDLKFQVEEIQNYLDRLSNQTNLQSELEKEKEKTYKIEELNLSLAKKLQQVMGTGGVNNPFQEEQIEVCKKLVRCSLCNDRFKNCVIARCYHVFCRECIYANLHERKRKCPGCGMPFAESDVHKIHM